MKTKKLVTVAMLSAMYVVLSLISINLGNIKITLDSLPIIVGAAFLGPVAGMLIGLLGSFINQLLTYGITVTTLLWIIPAGVRGLIIGLYAKKHGYEMNFGQTEFIVILSAVAVTVLNTAVMYADSKIFSYYSYAYVFGAVIPRFLIGIATAFVFGAFLPYLIKPLRSYLSKE